MILRWVKFLVEEAGCPALACQIYFGRLALHGTLKSADHWTWDQPQTSTLHWTPYPNTPEPGKVRFGRSVPSFAMNSSHQSNLFIRGYSQLSNLADNSANTSESFGSESGRFNIPSFNFLAITILFTQIHRDISGLLRSNGCRQQHAVLFGIPGFPLQ